MTAKNNRNRRNNRPLPVRLKRAVRFYYLRLARIDDPPERIARGAAIGVLMGILPTFGLGALLAIIFSFVFKANKAAALIGSIIMNPLTQPFFIAASITLGSVLLGENSSTILAAFKEDGITGGITTASVVYVLGNSIISTAFALASYFSVKKTIIRHRAHKRARKLAARERGEEA